MVRKTIILLLFISFQLFSYSQVKDKIITTNGETIICRIDSITSTHIYFSTVVRNILVQTYMEISMVSVYQPYVFQENFIDYNQDKPFIKEDFIDFSQDEPFLKINEKEDFIDFSQNKKFINNTGKILFFNAWLSFTNSSLKFKGILYEANDSSITLAGSVSINDYTNIEQEIMSFPINNIKIISTRKKNNTVRGIWIGAVSGLGVTLLTGFIASGANVGGAGVYGFFYGIPMALIGAGCGAIIATVPLGIPIHGDMNRYYRHKKMLERRALKR